MENVKTELSAGMDAVMASMGTRKFEVTGMTTMKLSANGTSSTPERGTLVLVGTYDHDDGKHDDEHMTCGQVREMYKKNECCGQPGKMFETDDKTRRLLSDIAE